MEWSKLNQLPVKILLINQAFYPDHVATAQHTSDLAVWLVEHGYDVTVLTSRRAYTQPKKLFPRLETYKGIRIIRLLGTGFGRGAVLLRIIDALTLHMAIFVRCYHRFYLAAACRLFGSAFLEIQGFTLDQLAYGH
jgi:hypothetical protein